MNEFKNHPKSQMMLQILESRYTDLEEEKRLCQALLMWATLEDDTYGKAFAYTYLGDYYVAGNQTKLTQAYLHRAEKLVDKLPKAQELRLRICISYGIYYEMQTDEQSAVKRYLEAMDLAQRTGDTVAECIVLNNLGVTFQRHKSHLVALDYFQKAYGLLQELPRLPIGMQILSNLAELSLLVENLEDAKKYILEFEADECIDDTKELFRRKNWCCYYAVLGDRAKAEAWAERILELGKWYKENQFEAFDYYNTLCSSMMKVKSQTYAKQFLLLMGEISSGTLDQLEPLEVKRLQYTVSFEPEEFHSAAYRRFYRKNETFRAQTNIMIVEAMETKIRLEKVAEQNEKLRKEHKNLQFQVNMDDLTGLYNRRFLDERMGEWVRGMGESPLGVIILDIDYFKEYNDIYGHMKGDEVLKDMGACLKAHSGRGIYPCRMGGDEFACLCESAPPEAMEEYIVAIREDLAERKIQHQGSSCNAYITLSIGYASESDHKNTETHLLLQVADQALYQSKLAGRNAYTKK